MEKNCVQVPPDSHLTLFNQMEFHQINPLPGQHPARYDYVIDRRLIGSLSGMVVGSEFVSGWSAPFGGPDMVRSSETATNVLGLIRSALDQAASDGISVLRIKAKPDFYSTSETAVQFGLLSLGFTVERCELNFHIDLTQIATIEDYVQRLKPSARRALKHSTAEPFTFSEAIDDDAWLKGYQILEKNRRNRNRELSLSFDYVLGIRDRFPGRIRMYRLFHAARHCASALVYQVSDKRELVVYWGDADHALARSPMNVLVERLVDRALRDGILTIDVGTSSGGGRPMQSVIQFKESVLARPRLRLDFLHRKS